MYAAVAYLRVKVSRASLLAQTPDAFSVQGFSATSNSVSVSDAISVVLLAASALISMAAPAFPTKT